MPQRANIEKVLEKAVEMEKKYNWPAASKLYEQAFGVIQTSDFLKKGEIQERIGFCLYRAAIQAESQEEFRERMQHAIEAYKNAYGFYERLPSKQPAARKFRCDAVVNYLDYWLSSNPSEKRKRLDACLELEDKALAAFLESGDLQEYRRTYNDLPLVFFFRVFLERDRQTLKSILERGLEWGAKAIAEPSELGNSYEIAATYLTIATCLSDAGFYLIAESEEIDRYRLKAVKYLGKAVELSKKANDAVLLGLAHLWLGINSGEEEAIRHHAKALEYGTRARDNFLIANGLDYLAYDTYWQARARAIDDPERRRKLAEEAMEYYEKARHHYRIISFISPRGGLIGPPSGQAEHYYHLALWEPNPKKRFEFLAKSEKLGMEALKLAEDSDMPMVVAQVLHVVSKTLQTQARTEPNSLEKKDRLEKALEYRERTIRIQEQLNPFFYWNRGVFLNYLAGIKAELADIELDRENKTRLLEDAVLSKKECLKLCNKVMPDFERKGETTLFAALRDYQDNYATLLARLHELTNKPEYLRKAIIALKESIKSASKVDMVSLMAESYWKVAKAQDAMGEHLEAAESFAQASQGFTKAAKKIPQLKEFYLNHSVYMQAWSQIEKARHHHAERRYGQAKEHYEKVASLHQSTERWNYLASNYLAWAKLEEAEDLSRGELEEEAPQAFKEASKLFCKARTSIKTALKKIQDADEKEMAAGLIKVSDLRHEYCQGRITLEEAKLLDRQSDYVASSKKYASATETFQKIAEAESEKSRKELQPIIYLCQAWQKMMMAEAKASSTMYGEAAELFKQAREHTVDQRTSLLALANSSFCKALGAGTEFEITRDMKKYSAAKQHMEAAENYYLKAGFKTASEYAKATSILFDAYMYLNQGQTEMEPRKKARYYQMTERLLQASAGSYMKAKHPGKGEEVHRLLESVREKRQLAMSLSEVLHAPTIASATTSFSTPTSTHEQAVGLGRFEHADIRASLILRLREVKIGQDMDLEIELVNAGKAPALLVKVQELIPEGFEVRRAPDIYRVEDSYINMKGKQLAPLKTEEIKLVLRAATKGTFILKPRITYLDETGTYRSHEPEPVTVTVKELGITGWIKGEN